MVPVIYIHFGELPDYLLDSIQQANKFKNEVILLSDREYKNSNCKWYPIFAYSEGLKEFESGYQHMSSNTPDFEIICIKRWFILFKSY